MAFYQLSSAWNPGYAIPKYVMSEPPGRGTFTTSWLPRGTISQLVPDVFAQKEPKIMPGSSLAKNSLSGGSLGLGDTLGSLGATKKGSEPNPMQVYGQKVASLALKIVAKVSPAERQTKLRELLNQIDPKLYAKVQALQPEMNLQTALQTALQEGITQEIISLGKGKSAKNAKFGLSGYFPSGPVGLGGWTDTVKNFIGETFGLACDVARNPATPIIAAGVAASQGAPPQAGAAGATVAAAACGGAGAQYMPGYIQPGMPGWVLPVAIGGGALLLIMALR